MIRELREAVDFLQDVDAKLHPLTAEILESHGLTKHMPEVKETVRRGRFGDPLPGLTS